MITNDTEQTALKYYQPQQTVLVQNTPSGAEYVFVNRASITMAWVANQDVDNLLGRRKSCCGNQKRIVFLPANEDDVRRWTNGGGR